MKKYILIIVTFCALSACKKWLDITPRTQVASADLFKTQEGFQEALNGVYTRASQGDLFGNELTSGFLDVMAQNFTLSTQLDPLGYLQTQKFNFTDANFINRANSTWSGLYNTIVNANLILANIDSKKSVFTNNNYSLIKGETLALRAYLHFEIFRMFGSSFASTGNPVGIPYVTTYSNKVTTTSSPQDVIKHIISDLDSAKALLQAFDPIISSDYIVGYPGADSTTESSSSSLFLQNRRNRMNYYAVCGELARVYLYEGDKANALLNASIVINSNKFHWTSQADFLNTDPKVQDKILYKELLFSWHIPKEVTGLFNRFQTNTGGMFLSPKDAQTIYETNSVGGEDLRYKVWFQPAIDGNLLFQKYARNPNGTTETDETLNPYPLNAPALRLSEMYYIAAESSYDIAPAKALEYLNQVRSVRGIISPLTITTKPDFIEELIKDARKEFYGEGQIFYMYKRLNQNIVGQGGLIISANDKIFVIPKPNNEIEFGG
jgi:hypothetical protein